MRDIAIYGFGGFGREVACLLNKINEIEPTWNMIGYFDDGVSPGTENKYGKVLGDIVTLNNFPSGLNVVIAIGNPQMIKNIVSKVTNPLIEFPNIIAPNVNIIDAEAFKIGRGNIVYWDCRLSCNVEIGDFNLINGTVTLGHDAQLGNFNVLNPATRLSGFCTVGNENLFGLQSIVMQGIKIGNKTKIGIGSVIIRNTKDESLYFGNPAKRIEGQ